jgi:hypothetical protein
MKKATDMSTEEGKREEERGYQTASLWVAGGGLAVLSEDQLDHLDRNLETFTNNRGELDHQDEHADPAADGSAALTGDLECRSRAVVREFWTQILEYDLDSYSEPFLVGFAFGVQAHVC